MGPGSSRLEGSGVRGLYVVLPCDVSFLPSPCSPDSQLSSTHLIPTASQLCPTLIPCPEFLLALGFHQGLEGFATMMQATTMAAFAQSACSWAPRTLAPSRPSTSYAPSFPSASLAMRSSHRRTAFVVRASESGKEGCLSFLASVCGKVLLAL